MVRDYRSLLMALATPALLLTLFGYALTLDVDNVPLAVWDQSGHGAEPGVDQPLRRLALFLASHVRRQLRRPGPGDRHGAGDDGPGRAARLRPKGQRRPRRRRATDRRRQRLEHGHHRHRLRRRDRPDLRPGPDHGAEPSAAAGGPDDPLGRAAAGLVQRGTGVAELHHSRPDRRHHDGHRGHAHLADRGAGMGAGHDGAVDLHAGEGRRVDPGQAACPISPSACATWWWPC